MKKLLCMLLCVMLIVTMMPTMAFAEGESGDDTQVGDYRLKSDLPICMNTWIPGEYEEIWYHLYQLDGDGDWMDVEEFEAEYAAELHHSDECRDKGISELELHTGDGVDHYAGFDVPDTCRPGCEIKVIASAKVDGNIVAGAEDTVSVSLEAYGIDIKEDAEVPDCPEMGDVVKFKDLLEFVKISRTLDGDGNLNEERQYDPVENPDICMAYDESRWKADGKAVHGGLTDLKKISPYGGDVNVTLKNGDNVLASRDFGFRGYEFYIDWPGDEPVVFTTQESVFVPVVKTDELSDAEASENCTISFKLGVWEDGFVPFDDEDQEGLCEPEPVVNEETGELGIKLYPQAIYEVLKDQMDENGEVWFEMQPYVTSGEETAPIHSSRGGLLINPDHVGDDESGNDEYRVFWPKDEDEEFEFLRIFNDQGKVNVPYEANGVLAEAEGCDLNFELGIWVDDEFFPLDCQTGLFEMKTDDETGETWLELDSAALAEQVKVDLEDNNETWIYFRPIVTEGEESFYINDDREILLIKSSTDFDYYMDNEQFLLPGEQFGVKNEVWANVRNAQFPDWEEFLLEVTDVSIEGGDGIVQLIPWEDECGWNVRALKTGEVVLKITHENYIEGGEPIIKEIPIHAVDDLWRTDVDYVDREKEDGKLKVTLMANARHQQYSRGEITETGEDYQVVWDLDDPDEAGAKIISEENETIIVTCDHVDRGFRVYYDIYEADADLTDESAEPIDSGERWIHMDKTFYTFDVTGFKEELDEEETMELEGRVVRHFMAGDEPAEETAEAEFGCWEDGGDSLEVTSETDDDGVFRASVTRRAAAGTSLWLEAHYVDDDIWWNRKLIINELKLGVSDETDEFYAYKLENGKYVRMNNIPVDGEKGYPAYFARESSNNEFYILWKAKEGVEAEELQLDVFEAEGWENRYVRDIDDGSSTGVDVELQEDLYQNAYYVWKITVGKDFDMAKTGMRLNVLEPPFCEECEGYEDCEECESCDDCRPYTFVMWILGEDYSWCPEDRYDDGIYVVQDIPEDKTWDILNVGSNDWSDINLSLSETAESERNTFYIIHKPGENLNLGLGQLHVYSITDSSGIGGGGFRVEKELDADSVLNLGTPIPVTIGGEAYEAIPVNLKHFLGHSYLYLTAESSSGELRACISFGLEVYFKGAVEGIDAVGPVANVIDRMFGYQTEFPDFDVVKYEDGSISAYFRDACAIITDIGQGSVCTVNIELKDEYFITDIHDGENPYIFLADDSALYKMWEAGKEPVEANWIDSNDELDAIGWNGPRSGGSSQADGTYKTAPGTVHRIATYGIDGVGYENTTYFKQFLEEKNLNSEVWGIFTDYNVYFDKSQYEGTDPADTIKIVFEVIHPETVEDSVQVVGRDDIKLETEVLDEEEYDSELYNENVQRLHGEDREVKKVYKITETSGSVAGNGFICITISADELDGGNLEDYTVAYFTEGGVPIVVKTTYIEEQGLVFTTGHFSNYAVIGKISESGGTPDETYAAAVDDVYYETLEEALLAALNAETAVTVTLMKDVATNGFVSVPVNAVLDLNGFTLEAEYFACFGNIVDNSEENTGVLVSDNVLVQKNNEQLPIKNDEGNYQFFEVPNIVAKMRDGETSRYFASSPKFERFAHSLIAKGSDLSGLSVIVKVKAKKAGADEYVEQDFVYSDQIVKGFADSHSYDTDTQTGSYKKHFMLTINNVDKYEDITCQVVIKTDPGVELKSDIVAYE